MGLDEMRAQLAALKKTSNKLSDVRDEEATISGEIVAEHERLDEEGRAALDKLALIREAEAWAKIPEADRANTMIRCVADWPTHKRTMKSGDIESGRGIIVVTSLERGAAVKAMRNRSKISSDGFSMYDASPEARNGGLMKATLYPAHEVLQVMLIESEPLCDAAYREAVFMSGALATAVSGKSES